MNFEEIRSCVFYNYLFRYVLNSNQISMLGVLLSTYGKKIEGIIPL